VTNSFRNIKDSVPSNASHS